MAAYYKHNMELLEKEVRDELFGDRDIYTKVRDSAPSKYGEEAVVKNSLISDGCVYEENLTLSGKDRSWLQKTLEGYGADVAGTWLLTVDKADHVIFLKKERVS